MEETSTAEVKVCRLSSLAVFHQTVSDSSSYVYTVDEICGEVEALPHSLQVRL